MPSQLQSRENGSSTPTSLSSGKMIPSLSNTRPPTLANAPRLPSQPLPPLVASAATTPTASNALGEQQQPQSRGSGSRRLTLGGILQKGKRSNSNASVTSAIPTSVSSGTPAPTTSVSRSSFDLAPAPASASSGPRSSFSLDIDRSTFNSGTSGTSTTTRATSTTTTTTIAASSKPPVSLPSFFRRRRSSSNERSHDPVASTSTSTLSGSVDGASSPSRRSSIDTGRRLSSLGLFQRKPTTDERDARSGINAWLANGSADEQAAARDSGSFSRTTSAASQTTGMARDRRRSSVGIPASPRIGGDDDSDGTNGSGHSEDEEDIADFVRFSGDMSGSHTSPSSPFVARVRRDTTASDSSSPRSASLPLPSPSSDRSDSPSSPPPISARRLTSSLHLSDLPLNHRTASSSNSVAPTGASSMTADTSPPSTTQAIVDPADASANTQNRLRSLPRLLSSDAYNFVSVQRSESVGNDNHSAEARVDTETETDGESETDNDTENSPTMASPTASGSRAPVMSPEQATMPRLVSVTRFNSLAILTPLVGAAPAPAPATSNVAAGATSGPAWVTFDPVTPTPGPIRTARISAYGSGPSESYFDLPRRAAANGSATPVTAANGTAAPLTTPLLPMSISSAARGRRPTRQDEIASPSIPTSSNVGRASVIRGSESRDASANGEVASEGPYRRRSYSAVELLSPSLLDEDNEPVGTAAITELDPVWQHAGEPVTPGPSFLHSPNVAESRVKSPIVSPRPASPSPARATGNVGTGSRIQRRRSMYELATDPPAYHAQYIRAGLPTQIVYPREEEGCEGLPDYSCAIHLEGYMPMKKEFSAPSVQARDRAWKKVYVILHGTSIKIYKYDLRTHPISGEEDWSTLSVQIAAQDGPPPLHFHPGEYGTEITPSQSTKFSINDARAKAKSRIVQAATSSDQNLLLRHYSLQNAESGLAADYIKRKHVVRVRAEGEQFLLQTNGDRGTIDLIEVLQAATNVALDLDTRVLPKFITLPRRRRRRRRVDPTAAPGGTTGTSAGAASGAGNGAGDVNSSRERASTRADPADRLGDMLEEEQHAYASATGGGSTV